MSKANSLAIEAAMCYLERLENQPMGYWRSSEFAQLSYAKTAAREVVDLLKNDDSKPPLVIIEEYVDKMNKYACLNKERSIMFSVAADTAEDMIHELLCAYY